MPHIFKTAMTASVIICAASAAMADVDRCAAVANSVSEAGVNTTVTVACNDTHAFIESGSFPDHEVMAGISITNEKIPVGIRYAAPIILSPTMGSTPTTRDTALGVAVNGVRIYDYTAGGEMTQADLAHYQAQLDTFKTQQLDECGGHAGENNDYHYHMKPTCLIDRMDNAGDDAIIGWAFDGYPIYGDNNPDGTEVAEGDLDICNGQSDDTYGYRYHTSAEAPYIIQCLVGEVPDIDNLPLVPPLHLATPIEDGRPPRGRVENLFFSREGGDAMSSMEYTYEGEDYYIRYDPSGTRGCYNFYTKTVADNGEEKMFTLCR